MNYSMQFQDLIKGDLAHALSQMKQIKSGQMK